MAAGDQIKLGFQVSYLLIKKLIYFRLIVKDEELVLIILNLIELSVKLHYACSRSHGKM
jgi:hypothetical protein